MKNTNQWQPTKVRRRADGKLVIPANKDALAPGSVLMASLVARWYNNYLPQYAKGTLLELGCAKLPYFDLYQKYVDDVVCTDWPQTFHGVAFTDFLSDLNKGIPLISECIDTVIASDILEHLKKPDSLFCEMHRVLNKEGIVFINVPFFYWVHEAPFDYFRYTPYAIRHMAENAGFEVLILDSIGGSAFVLVDLLSKIIGGRSLISNNIAVILQRIFLFFIDKYPNSDIYPLFIGAILKKRS